jgi:hypothetical protein
MKKKDDMVYYIYTIYIIYIYNKYIYIYIIYIYYGVLFSHKEKWNYVLCRKMDGTGEHHIKQNKPDSERQASMFSLIFEI